MKRRDFIKVLAGTAVSPSVATGQGRSLPVIGFLGVEAVDPKVLAKFHQGLNERGYFEGRNVTIEYQWAINSQQISMLAARLVQHRVALIVTTGGAFAAKAAKEMTTTIPILFGGVGVDPVESGFLASFNRPDSNATGVSQSYKELIPKRLELLQYMVPKASKIAYLQNDDSTGLGPSEKFQFEAETHIANGLGLTVHYARNENDIEAAFASMAQQRAEAFLVASDPLFGHRRAMIASLAARYALPGGYSRREFADAGGLMSYGPSITEAWRQIGEYAGRILNGARPEALPVQLQNKYELVINTRTAKALELTVPPLLHALADEIIE